MASQLVLMLDDNGQFRVEGPIQDRVLCYGLLEMAKDLIRNQELPMTKPMPKLVPVPSFGGLQNGQGF